MRKGYRPGSRTKIRSLPPPGQLELPIDYSLSERDALSRNRERSKAKHAQRRQVRPATNRANRAQSGIVRESTSRIFANLSKYFCQGQRISLTPTLSTIITNVNGKRWQGYVSALPPFIGFADLEPRQGRAHGRCGSRRRLPANPLVADQRRTKLPALRLPRRLFLPDPRPVQVQGV